MQDTSFEQLLLEFYTEYLKWVDSGTEKGFPFETHEGLCSSLERYLTSRGLDFNECDKVVKIMAGQFIEAGLNSFYPFNTDKAEYQDECEENSVHLNPARIQWVRDRVAGKPVRCEDGK